MFHIFRIAEAAFVELVGSFCCDSKLLEVHIVSAVAEVGFVLVFDNTLGARKFINYIIQFLISNLIKKNTFNAFKALPSVESSSTSPAF